MGFFQTARVYLAVYIHIIRPFKNIHVFPRKSLKLQEINNAKEERRVNYTCKIIIEKDR